MNVSKTSLGAALGLALALASGTPSNSHASVTIGNQTCVQVWGLYEYQTNGQTDSLQWEPDGVNCYDNPGGMGGDIGGYDGSWAYGGGGPGPSYSNQQMCQILLAGRPSPSDCPNPIGKPAGATYGEQSNVGAIGTMRRFIADQNRYAPIAQHVANALSAHTANIANGMSFFDSTAALRQSLTQACGPMLRDMLATTNEHIDMVPRGVTVLFCNVTLSRFDEEATGGVGFINWVMNDYSNVGFIDYTDIPYSGTITNALAFENSLVAKYSEVARDSSCHNFWNAMERFKCAG